MDGFCVNIAQYLECVFLSGSKYQTIMLKMTNELMKLEIERIKHNPSRSKIALEPFKGFLKRLQFVEETKNEIQELAVNFLEKSNQIITEIDFTSKGKVDQPIKRNTKKGSIW